MSFEVPIDEVRKSFPTLMVVRRLTASEQKCAFEVRDGAGHNLCLKIIKPGSDRQRLDREITAMESVRHSNVARLVQYHPPDKSDARHYTLEGFIAGNDLADKFAAGPMKEREVAQLFAQVFDGLSALQAADLVHRDLKPTNIRVTGTGRPVIIDFGLVRCLALPDVTKTADGASIGTPLYFAPEQFVGTKADIDPRTDFFAAGILIYTALNGAHPFATPRMTFEQLKNAICAPQPKFDSGPISTITPPMKVVLAKLLQRHRLDRPSSAAAVAEMLRKIGGKK